MTLCLSPDELIELTHYRRKGAQANALRQMGILFKERPDGSLAVLQAHINQVLGAPVASAVKRQRIEPNWDAVR